MIDFTIDDITRKRVLTLQATKTKKQKLGKNDFFTIPNFSGSAYSGTNHKSFILFNVAGISGGHLKCDCITRNFEDGIRFCLFSHEINHMVIV